MLFVHNLDNVPYNVLCLIDRYLVFARYLLETNAVYKFPLCKVSVFFVKYPLIYKKNPLLDGYFLNLIQPLTHNVFPFKEIVYNFSRLRYFDC